MPSNDITLNAEGQTQLEIILDAADQDALAEKLAPLVAAIVMSPTARQGILEDAAQLIIPRLDQSIDRKLRDAGVTRKGGQQDA